MNGTSNKAIKKAVAHQESGRLQDAERLFRSVLKSEPHHPVANHGLGVLSVTRGKYQAAIPFLNAALQANPQEQRYWFSLAEALIEAGAISDARSVLEKGASFGLSGPSAATLAMRLKQWELYQLALQHHQAGRLVEAEQGYTEILSNDPPHVDSLHMLGVMALHNNHLESAVVMISEAIRLKGGVASFHCNLGNALDGLGRFDEAIKSYNEALRLDPSDFDTRNNLGTTLLNLEKLDEALAHFERAVVMRPHDAVPHNNIGNVLKAKKDYDRAIKYYEKAISLDPSYVKAYNNMGVVLREIGQPDKSFEWYRQALQIDPNFGEAHNNLGDLLMARGELQAAEEHYLQAIKFGSDAAVAHTNIGVLLRVRGGLSKSIPHFRECVRLKPDSADARSTLGDILALHGQYDEALSHIEEALRLQPDHTPATYVLANIFKDQGKLSEAVAQYDKCVHLEPSIAHHHSNLILALIYAADIPPTELVDRARNFDEVVAAPLLRRRPFLNVADPDRRLRIGFVSADFRRHAVNYFFEPLLTHLDRRPFETFAYSHSYNEDDVTARLKKKFDYWRNVATLDDDAAADLIEADGIDILVDLSSHTGGNRLLIFARKPAPIQVTWLGFSATTGMRAMDYRITDHYAEPAGMTEHLSVETLWRLPRIFCCYQGAVDNVPAVVDHPPKDDHGYVTFGCFNNFARVSDPALALWARIMALVPNARLLLEIGGLNNVKFRTELEERLTRLGLPLDRVILEPRSPANQFVLYNKIDIALDPFPGNGGTTSMDTLWMGVPFVTLAGNTFSSRFGVTILTNAGLPELIAADEGQYVELAVELATDDARLRALRSRLRERKSALMDQAAFARDMENAYRDMWKIWCEQQNGKASKSAVAGPR